MAIIKPFKGIRPQKKYVDRVACKPYDVLNSEEAKMEARDNAISFLHVEKAEIDLPPETDLYDKSVYQKAKENFNKMVSDGIFSQDSSDSLYVYSQTWKGKTQFGLVGCASVEDYWNNIIKRHELTRPDKENDRKNHIETTNIQSGPIFLTYPDVAEVDQIISLITKDNPEYNFIASDEVEHTFWLIQNSEIIQKLVHIFEKIPSIYIADGHHRSASASIVGREKKENNPKHTGQEEYNFFLAVYFPASQLRIMDYNRVVKDLNGLNESEFLDKIKAYFDITQIKYELYKPNKLHEIGMYLGQKWYSLLAKEGTYDDFDPIGVLDVTILSKCILDPILGIQDLRRDKRIDFVGGIRGSEELKKRVDSNEMKVAFAMYPVSIEQLITISDTGNIMPPKTTWFEPKLRSGLVVHSIE
ncbi:MAG: DUF1015 domain-containing protein [Leptospiraceae bacterium]|nr:DUF1015 domain-containing protein [Leptospiraceae bacterium]MCP5493902.1 DUF1015 domain-containing protein [Leptospiraceae bacterium]